MRFAIVLFLLTPALWCVRAAPSEADGRGGGFRGVSPHRGVAAAARGWHPGTLSARRPTRFVGVGGYGRYSYYPYYGYSFGSYWSPYAYPVESSANIPTPPYFAIHPPVYYGRRVGMPYGNSPLPRPPRPVVRTSYTASRPAPARGVMIENPHVDSRTTDQEDTAQRRSVVSKPKTILNPYVASSGQGRAERVAAN